MVSGVSEDKPKSQIFYDGSCPLCRAEMEQYMALDAGGDFSFIDMAESPQSVESIGVSRQEAMARLHVRLSDGRIVTRVDAFIAIWEKLPKFRWLAWVFKARPMKALFNAFYRWFAPRRHFFSKIAARYWP